MRTQRQLILLAVLINVLGGAATAVAAAEPASTSATNPSSPSGIIAIARGTPQRQAAEQALRTLADHPLAHSSGRYAGRILAVDRDDALRRATIGYGFEMYVIDPGPLLAGDGIDASLRHTGVWRFVVLLDDSAVGLITVAKLQGRWQMVEVGAAALAADIADVITSYEASQPPPRMRFVRSEQGHADFVEVMPPAVSGSPAEPGYVPLLSARSLAATGAGATQQNGLAAVKRAAMSEQDILPVLRESVRRGMVDPRFDHPGAAP
ncbi:hypothetical protein LJR230_001054 [Trinickia sp. LjRoot230]|uniref:hypothetical protein n=1 Tax=Trinickia sp. LjRoot230 TaxID=3342288 RepID=UPI003ECF1093